MTAKQKREQQSKEQTQSHDIHIGTLAWLFSLNVIRSIYYIIKTLQVLASEGHTESCEEGTVARQWKATYQRGREQRWKEFETLILLKTALYLTEKNRRLGIDSY
jgi:hypothetical protein